MKSRKMRNTGGVNDAAEDLSKKNEARTNAPEIDNAAEERKKGGRVKRKEGGKVDGYDTMKHAGRKPRKSGGRAACESAPFTTAAKGEAPKGRNLDMEMDSL